MEKLNSLKGTQFGGNHYKGMKIEPVEFIESIGLGFTLGSAVKYIARQNLKNGSVDLQKAIHFITMELERVYGIQTQFSFSDGTVTDADTSDLNEDGDLMPLGEEAVCECDDSGRDCVVSDEVELLTRSNHSLQRAIDELAKSRDGWEQEAKSVTVRFNETLRELRTLEAVTKNDFWVWQGNGEDYPESLTCRVVMTADQLRDLLKPCDKVHQSEEPTPKTSTETYQSFVQRIYPNAHVVNNAYDGGRIQCRIEAATRHDAYVWIGKAASTENEAWKSALDRILPSQRGAEYEVRKVYPYATCTRDGGSYKIDKSVTYAEFDWISDPCQSGRNAWWSALKRIIELRDGSEETLSRPPMPQMPMNEIMLDVRMTYPFAKSMRFPDGEWQIDNDIDEIDSNWISDKVKTEEKAWRSAMERIYGQYQTKTGASK